MRFHQLLAGALASSFAFISMSTSGDAAQVKVRSTLGQSTIVAGETEKVYLRISLEGIPLLTSERRTPVNVALVIDRSGSMGGNKIQQAKEASIMALNRLSIDDFAAVVAYNHEVDVIVPATRVAGHREMAADIRRLRSNGRTALYAGTKQGVREVRKFLSDNKVNRVILLSDGLANVGPSRPEDLAELARDVVREGISVTTIGLGLGYNEDLMAKLAYNSDGNHAFVEHPGDL
ncbi:MAG: VWA domain-containing protein, partial [Hyphomicrobiaceae bacterium]